MGGYGECKGEKCPSQLSGVTVSGMNEGTIFPWRKFSQYAGEKNSRFLASCCPINKEQHKTRKLKMFWTKLWMVKNKLKFISSTFKFFFKNSVAWGKSKGNMRCTESPGECRQAMPTTVVVF